MDDEADRHQAVAVVIEERAAARAGAQRPTKTVLDETPLEIARRDLPDLLQADAEFLRIAPGVEREFGDELLRQRPARALGDQRVFAAQLHAAGEIILWLAVAADAHVAGGDADHLAVVAIEHLG